MCNMCHTYFTMTPFKINLNSRQSIFDQVVIEATRAILAGTLKPGDSFPSVRTLAKDLRIHPNTAHKAVQHLIKEGWLFVVPGKGTTVQVPLKKARSSGDSLLLKNEIAQLVNEAKRLGVSKKKVIELINLESWGVDKVKAVSNDS